MNTISNHRKENKHRNSEKEKQQSCDQLEKIGKTREELNWGRKLEEKAAERPVRGGRKRGSNLGSNKLQ